MSIGPLQRLAFYFICLIWGTTWMAVHVLVQYVPPFRAAAMRFIVAAGLLFVLALLRKSRWPKQERQWNAILVLAFTMMCIPYGLQFWGQQFVTSSMTAVLFSALPLLAALLTPLMLHRKVPRQAVFAMVMAFGALLYLFYEDLAASRRTLIGGLAIVGSVLLSAWSVVYAKERLHDVDPVISTGLQLLIGSVGLFWATWALESHQQSTWTKTAIVCVLFLAFLGSAAAFAIYYWLLKQMQPYQLSSLNLVVPIIAVLEGSLILHEAIPLRMIVAMIVVLGGVSAVLRAEAVKEEPQTLSIKQGEG